MPRGMTRFTLLALALSAMAALATAPASARSFDPEVLWKIVHGKCAPDEATKRDPSPCLAVDLSRGDAVLKDRNGATQVLVIPTERATGIESRVVLGPAGVRYIQDAWRAHRFVEKLAGRPIPRDDLGLAVNSMDGRTQNQLHIHVDCLRADVKAALATASPSLGDAWTTLPLAGHAYRARRLSADDLGRLNLFRLIAASDPAARANMGLETMVVAAATFPGGVPGFVLLNDRSDPEAGDYASGEELQDHTCQLLQPTAQPSR